MKRYVQDMSPEERKVWRRWQIRWTCVYAVVLAVLSFHPARPVLAGTPVPQHTVGEDKAAHGLLQLLRGGGLVSAVQVQRREDVRLLHLRKRLHDPFGGHRQAAELVDDQ